MRFGSVNAQCATFCSFIYVEAISSLTRLGSVGNTEEYDEFTRSNTSSLSNLSKRRMAQFPLGKCEWASATPTSINIDRISALGSFTVKRPAPGLRIANILKSACVPTLKTCAPPHCSVIKTPGKASAYSDMRSSIKNSIE